MRPSGLDSTHPIAICMVGSPEAKSREVAISDALLPHCSWVTSYSSPIPGYGRVADNTLGFVGPAAAVNEIRVAAHAICPLRQLRDDNRSPPVLFPMPSVFHFT